MPINTRELLEAISIVADREEMRVTVKSSGKGAIITAGTCFIGGILLGPVGMAIGGTVGGIGAYMNAKGSFKPVSEIIKNDLTYNEQQMLYEKLMVAIRDISATDAAMLLPLIMGNPATKAAVLSTITSFITNELHQQIC